MSRAHETPQPDVSQQGLDSIVPRLVEQWLSLHRKRPRYLYHYTSAQGLLGMLQSNRVWATNSRFMNDPTEIGYATRLVREVVDAELLNQDARWAKEVKTGVNNFINYYDSQAKVYIACFCTEGDLLSQWRGYGSVGGGYSIGFLGKHTGAQVITSGEKPEPILRKVIYDRRTQERLVRDWVRGLSLLGQLRRKSPNQLSAQQRFKQCWGDFNMFLSECLNCFKDPAYREEQEWRIIQFGRFDEQDVIKASFRPRGERLVPYVELDFSPARGPYSGKLPIRFIRYGPTLEPVVTERSLQLLREAYGYDESRLTIARSGVPFSG